MNKVQKELLEKATDIRPDSKLPLFKGIYIIQQKKLHDSGYRMMYVIGHTDYDERIKDFNYYLIGTYSDVVDFISWRGNPSISDLHLDINKNGIIHIWTNDNRSLKCSIPYISNCMLEIV